jgi:plasmid stabilization system protein ParE
MAFKVIWTEEAIKSFESVIDYLQTYFTEKEIAKLVNATNDKIGFIEINPLMYRKSRRFKNLHYTNILRKVILVYRFNPRLKVVELIHFWDGRQDPKKFKV